MHTVLVIGGYGFFGQRICAALATHPGVFLLVGGRNHASGRQLARALHIRDEQAVTVDAASNSLASVLKGLGVNTVVHTAGPFQGQDYTVARAAIAAGCHYIDLADGRQFVAGIEALDSLAKSRGVSVVSGASSVPALSSAVVDRFLGEFARLDGIRMGISSGARAPGLATVRGVFSYAGKPLQQMRNGSWCTEFGWRGLERHRFPKPLGRRWMGTCDVPDLDLLPRRYPTVKSVTFQAGFASDAGHLLVWGLAGLVKAGILASLVPFAPTLNRVSRWMEPIVSHKGGMFVTLTGIGTHGQPRAITWNIIAQHNHGPYIPCAASIVLARKLADGHALPSGALPCMGLLTVAEYLDAIKGLDVQEIVE